MLSERISTLFALLQCSNTDVARYAGCSPSNISHLRTGNREPKPSSRTVAVFAEGVYGYADYENLLSVLCELCGAEDTTRESVTSALIGWLYETKDAAPPPRAVTPKSKRARALRRQSFGERLDRAMTLLELSNTQLAGLLSIDTSLVSRYRSGVYSPHGNEQLSEKLSSVLLSRAEKSRQTAELAELCGVSVGELDAPAVAVWLYETTDEDNTALAQMLMRSLDNYTPGQGLPTAVPELPPIETASCYWGTDGLRSAVVRFLSDAAKEGGELLLYSDEPMEWMTGDREYFALWASLMVACVKNGVKIKIIHNVDRSGNEIIDAIKGWLPLYISGMIEPYVFRREKSARFCHTVFLHTGGACVHGVFPAGAGNARWYDYYTDAPHLDALKREYGKMLSSASPFLKTYTAATSGEFRAFRIERQGARDYLLTELPIATMPKRLLEHMLSRAGISEEKKSAALSHYRDIRGRFSEVLEQGGVNMILCPPDEDGPRVHRVNFSLDLLDIPIDYTKEEYAEHIAAVMDLVKNERNFHLTLLPSAPFRDIQIVTLGDAVAVLRCQEPYAAFVFLNPTLTRSVSGYFAALIEQFAADRYTTVQKLHKKMWKQQR